MGKTGVPTAVSAPSAATENTDTVPSVELAVASNSPDGLNATEAGPTPVANGEPATGVNAGCASAPAAPANRPAHANPTTSTTRRTHTPTITTSSISRPDLGDSGRTGSSHEGSPIITSPGPPAHRRTNGWFLNHPFRVTLNAGYRRRRNQCLADDRFDRPPPHAVATAFATPRSHSSLPPNDWFATAAATAAGDCSSRMR